MNEKYIEIDNDEAALKFHLSLTYVACTETLLHFPQIEFELLLWSFHFRSAY